MIADEEEREAEDGNEEVGVGALSALSDACDIEAELGIS